MRLVRTELLAQPELVQDLVPAARERFGDAQAALLHGSPTGSVYLAGYCVEMVLKHAALRAEGVPPYAHVRDALAPARARLQLWRGAVEHDHYHSLEFWALLLRETFRHRGGEIPPIAAAGAGRATRLHHGWHVALRYRSAMIPMQDAQAFLRDAGWFHVRAHELWR